MATNFSDNLPVYGTFTSINESTAQDSFKDIFIKLISLYLIHYLLQLLVYVC